MIREMIFVDDFYPIYMYTPMSEMHNEMIPVTMGCSYQRCLYCDLNYRQKFKIFPIEEIRDYILKHKCELDKINRKPTKFTLLEGNPLCIKTDYLLEIFKILNVNFDVDYISMFARANDVLNKTDEELLKLKDMGMDRLCLGLESGSDLVLDFQKKGHSVSDSIEACHKLDRLGISYSTYFMLGLGGKEFTEDHRTKTPILINQIKPFEIIFVTTVIFKRAPLKKLVQDQSFKRLSIRESLEEEREILKNINIDTIIKASHKTNALPLLAKFPEHKDLCIEKIDKYLENSDKILQANERNKWKVWGKE